MFGFSNWANPPPVRPNALTRVLISTTESKTRKMETPQTTFDNTFNLVTGDISKIEVKENYDQKNCLIRDKISHSTYYKTFILDENSKTKIVCDVAFYPSSITSKYLPRLTFKKIDNNGSQKEIEPTTYESIGRKVRKICNELLNADILSRKDDKSYEIKNQTT